MKIRTAGKLHVTFGNLVRELTLGVEHEERLRPTATLPIMTATEPNPVYVLGSSSEGRKRLSAFLERSAYQAVDCDSPKRMLESLDTEEPSCVVIDVSNLRIDGLEMLAELKARRPDIPVVLVASTDQLSATMSALKSSNVEFVGNFHNDPGEFLSAVKRVMTGDDLVSTGDILQEVRRLDITKQLSPRECDVLKLLVRGNQNKAVAHELGISPRTVEVHRSRLMRRLKVTSFAELIKVAIEAGFDR